jgi:HEAT repeat protein
MANVFISYVHEDSALVVRLADNLTAFGITVWLDRNSIEPGARWKDSIREGISHGDFFIACFSNAYAQRSKTYMNEELTLAIDELRQRPTDQAWFIPVLVDDCKPERRAIGAGETLADLQHVPLFRDWDDGIRRILAVIQPISSMEFMLRKSLKDASARKRITAADALAKMGAQAKPSVPDLLPLLHDSNETVVAAAAAALGEIGLASREIVSQLLEITSSDDHPYYPSKHANEALVTIGLPVVPHLIHILREQGLRSNSTGEAALKTLARIGEPALPYVFEELRKGDADSKNLMAKVIAVIEKPSIDARPKAINDSTAVFIEMLQATQGPEDSDTVLFNRATAADALGSLGDPAAVPALIEALKDSNYLSVCAAAALAKIGDFRAVDALTAVLKDTNKFWVPRGAAAVALGKLGEASIPALPALREALEYNCDTSGEKWDLRAKEAVADAIAHISDKNAVCSLMGKGYKYEMWGIY